MGSQDNISIVALLVSLIALVVALGQMLQQYLSTAEGYRRCAPSVLGPWAQLRRRHWVWSELRFETTYVAPHLVCVTPDELAILGRANQLNSQYRNQHNQVVRIVSRDLDTSSPELDKTVHGRTKRQRDQFGPTNEQQGGNLRKTLADLESELQLSVRRRTTDIPQDARLGDRYDNGIFVSWISLLQNVHDLYSSYWPTDCLEKCRIKRGNRTGSEASEYPSTLRHALEGLDEEDGKVNTENHDRTDAVAVYRKWSWDFMPAELTKPLASSTVRDVIIMGLRLGMEWRKVDPGRGEMAGDGGERSFETYEMRGLGLVLKFTALSCSQDRFPQFIANRAVDKMLFGIIPGDPFLVRQDIPLINEERVEVQERFKIVYQAIDPTGALVDTCLKKKDDYTFVLTNEVTILLCPFLADPQCSAIRIPTSVFCKPRKSIFHFWEGRFGVLQVLGETERPPGSALNEVYQVLRRLEEYHEADFYGRWDQKTINKSKEERQKLIEFARAQFDHTTRWFHSHGFARWNKWYGSSSQCTFFMTLIAAQCHMSLHVANEYFKQPPVEKPRHEYGLPDGKYQFFVHDIFDMARRYAGALEDPKHGVVKYMKEHGMPASSAEHIMEAWYKMVLRGILWDMCISELLDVKQPFPSSMYTNTTPVWII